MEAELIVDTRADLSDESLEWSSWQELSGLPLVLSDFSKSNGTWLESHLSFFMRDLGIFLDGL